MDQRLVLYFFNPMMMANQYGNAKLIKQIPFAIATEQEVETVRTYTEYDEVRFG